MELILLHIRPGANSFGDRPLKSDLTPESKSTSTPSRSQKILYFLLLLELLLSSSLSSLDFAEVKKPVSDCCCLATFLFLVGEFEELLLRFDMIDGGAAEINAETTEEEDNDDDDEERRTMVAMRCAE